MNRKYSFDGPCARAAISLIFLSALAACGSSPSAGAAPGGSSDSGGHDNGDSSVGTGSDGAVTATGDASGRSDGSPGQEAAADGGPDSASTDGGGVPADGAGADGGVHDVGSCCAAQTTPGCSNASLEVCVCEKDRSCCTTAWGLQCALIVQQKYCQPNVRDCVCGTDAGQWGQTSCCTTDWTSTCDSVATIKCSAVQGCF
jgi:hypothetical protein